MADLTQLMKLGSDPIPGDAPGGASVQYDEDYEALRAEVQKLDSVEQDPVDWGMVADTCADILATRSKHLLVTVYLAQALLEREGFPGLVTGLTVCRDVMAGFWDVLEPPLKRKRGRIEAINWLAERGGRAAAERKPGTDDKETLQSCVSLMKEIEGFLTEKLENDAPGFGDLRRAVQQHVQDIEAAEKAAEAARKRAAERAAAGEIEGLATPEDARKAFAKVRTTVKQVCDFLRKADNADPVAYRMIRAVTWGGHKEPPPNQNGTTQIPAPAPEMAARLAELYQKSDWANLIEGAEAAFGTAIFWLDIHRWTALALTGLGATHADAADAVIDQVGLLAARLPELLTLSFADGTPFVSDETKSWIESDVLSRFGGGDGGGAPAGAHNDGPEGLADAVKDARRLAGKGKLPEAIKLMQTGVAATGDYRDQFLWRLEMSRLCLDSGQPMLAAPQLEDLEALIDRHNLEQWEPKLCLAVFSALLTARRLLLKDQRKATPELMQKTNELHNRLTRLDAAAGLALSGK